MEAAADKPTPEEPPEFAALREIAETYRADNERLRAQLANVLLQQAPNDPELKPLKMLCETPAEYEAARRAQRSHKLQVVKHGGGLFSKPLWIKRWRGLMGR